MSIENKSEEAVAFIGVAVLRTISEEAGGAALTRIELFPIEPENVGSDLWRALMKDSMSNDRWDCLTTCAAEGKPRCFFVNYVFTEDDTDEELAVTNAYVLKLTGEQAVLYQSMSRFFLHWQDPHEIIAALVLILPLTDNEGDTNPMFEMLNSLIQQFTALQIPKVIPFGQSER